MRGDRIYGNYIEDPIILPQEISNIRKLIKSKETFKYPDNINDQYYVIGVEDGYFNNPDMEEYKLAKERLKIEKIIKNHLETRIYNYRYLAATDFDANQRYIDFQIADALEIILNQLEEEWEWKKLKIK